MRVDPARCVQTDLPNRLFRDVRAVRWVGARERSARVLLHRRIPGRRHEAGPAPSGLAEIHPMARVRRHRYGTPEREARTDRERSTASRRVALERSQQILHRLEPLLWILPQAALDHCVHPARNLGRRGGHLGRPQDRLARPNSRGGHHSGPSAMYPGEPRDDTARAHLFICREVGWTFLRRTPARCFERRARRRRASPDLR